MQRQLFDESHDMFRASFRAFIDKELAPHQAEWEAAGIVPHEMFEAAGSNGFLGMRVPEEYGGGGADDFRFNFVIGEEIQRAGIGGIGLGITLHNDICLPYLVSLGTEEQKRRWLPRVCSGELVLAVAMTEPSMGSDLASMKTAARRDGDTYVLDGSKTFISNGINSDLVITAAKTDPSQRHKGISLLVVERGMDGFERGRNLDKIGLHSQDTAELFFHGVHVPATNLLGQEGAGFLHLVQNLPHERLSMAVTGVAAARQALEWTLAYVEEREAFGQRVADFQNTRFVLAEIATEVEVAQAFVDRCIEAHDRDELSVEEAAMAKWWCTELQKRTVDRCLQLHGGYGYMTEYPISRAYVDARVTTIYGGTTEIMKGLIGKSLKSRG